MTNIKPVSLCAKCWHRSSGKLCQRGLRQGKVEQCQWFSGLKEAK